MSTEKREASKGWGAEFEAQARWHHYIAMVWAVCLVATVAFGMTVWFQDPIQTAVAPSTQPSGDVTIKIPDEEENRPTPTVSGKKIPEDAEDTSSPSALSFLPSLPPLPSSSPQPVPSPQSVLSPQSILSSLSVLSLSVPSSLSASGDSSVHQQYLPIINTLLWHGLARDILNRLAPFLVFAFMLLFLAKNCMAHRHNQIVNRHCANALSVCQQLAHEEMKAGEINRFILQQTAHHVWTTEESGFIRGTKNLKGDGVSVNLSGFSGRSRINPLDTEADTHKD